MSNLVIDRLLWFHKKSTRLDFQKVRYDLTLFPESYMGAAQDPIPLYEESDDWFGVPRAWGLKQRWLVDGISIEDRTSFPKIDWPHFTGLYRTGQEESVRKLLSVVDEGEKYGALLEAKAGTGKTVMSTVFASMLGTPTLVIVHKEDLADQWKMLLTGGTKDGKLVPPLFPGGRVGHVQGDLWDYRDKHLVTAMAQTLHARKYREPDGFYRSFGLVIFDEAHRYPARTFEEVMRMTQSKFRLGVSATFRRTDGMECIWHWHVGGIEHRTQGVHLVGHYHQVGWGTSVTDDMFRLRGMINHSRYITAISRNVPYNEWLAEQLAAGANAGRQVLLASHRTEQLSDIRTRILSKGNGVTVGYYAGEVDGRKITKAELESSKTCQIVLATYHKMSEGTDIATLDTLFLGTPASDIEQVVGRIQRPLSDKKPVLVVDPVWLTPYNQGLGRKREKIYERLGFTPQPKE
jgi:superfamily II DNA or RNA helicase